MSVSSLQNNITSILFGFFSYTYIYIYMQTGLGIYLVSFRLLAYQLLLVI